MAVRIVALGPRVGDELVALELDSLSADALVTQCGWRTTLSLHGGELADATVIVREKTWPVGRAVAMAEWRELRRLTPMGREFRLNN